MSGLTAGSPGCGIATVVDITGSAADFLPSCRETNAAYLPVGRL